MTTCKTCDERPEVMGALVNGKCFLCRDDEAREDEAKWLASQNQTMTRDEHREMLEGRKRTILREGENL